MKIHHKNVLSLLLIVIIPIGNYLTFFNTGTYKDEVILIFSFILIFFLYVFFLRGYQEAYKGVLSLSEKASGSIISFKGAEALKDSDKIQALNQLFDTLTGSVEKATSFVENVKAGNFDTNILSDDGEEDSNDPLMGSLQGLRSHMIALEIEEKERKWVTEGMAKFVDILRGNNESSKEFYESIIINIVKYLNANQGSLFLVTEKSGKKVLSMEACYAYNRKKFINKEIAIGEGMVGQAYLEKETIFLKEIPENYVTITSGLGEAPPRNLLLVPFKLNEEVECILEVATFQEIKKYQIDFLEKLGESIASSISALKINENTKILLQETQSQTEALRAQEEEMRQNMEELQATQESLERESKEKENVQKDIQKTIDFMQSIINALPDPVFVKDRNHNVVIVNEAFCKLNKIDAKEILGKNDYDMFAKEEADVFFADEEKLFLERSEFMEEEKVTRDGVISYRITKKRIIEDDDGALFLVGMNHDITQRKEMEKALEKEKYLMDALMNNATDNIYFKNEESKFIRVSENMLSIFKAKSQDEVVGKSDFDFFTEEHARPAFEGEQEIIRTGKPILNLVEKETFEDGHFSYVSTTKVPLKDLEGKTVGTFGISRDVTESKVIELEMKKREKLISSAFNYSDEILLIIDSKKSLNFISPNAKKILGLDSNTMLNQTFKDFIYKDDIKKVEQALKQVQRADQIVIQFRHATGDGNYIAVESEIYNALHNTDIDGYVFKVKAITESLPA